MSREGKEPKYTKLVDIFFYRMYTETTNLEQDNTATKCIRLEPPLMYSGEGDELNFFSLSTETLKAFTKKKKIKTSIL